MPTDHRAELAKIKRFDQPIAICVTKWLADRARLLRGCGRFLLRLRGRRAWLENDADVEGWCRRWRAAFMLRHSEVITTSKNLSIRLAN